MYSILRYIQEGYSNCSPLFCTGAQATRDAPPNKHPYNGTLAVLMVCLDQINLENLYRPIYFTSMLEINSTNSRILQEK